MFKRALVTVACAAALSGGMAVPASAITVTVSGDNCTFRTNAMDREIGKNFFRLTGDPFNAFAEESVMTRGEARETLEQVPLVKKRMPQLIQFYRDGANDYSKSADERRQYQLAVTQMEDFAFFLDRYIDKLQKCAAGETSNGAATNELSSADGTPTGGGIALITVGVIAAVAAIVAAVLPMLGSVLPPQLAAMIPGFGI